MVKDQRRKFAALLFFGLFVPVLAVFSMMLLAPGAVRPFTAGGGLPVAFMGRGGAGAIGAGATRAKDAPLRAASDGHDLWVVHPFLYSERDEKTTARGFELYERTGNSGVWSLLARGSDTYWTGHPQAIAVVPFSTGGASQEAVPGVPYVINEGGNVSTFSSEGSSTVDQLPPTHLVKAAAASTRGVFAVTLGVAGADGASAQVGERLWPRKNYSSTINMGNPLPAVATSTAPAPLSANGLNTTTLPTLPPEATSAPATTTAASNPAAAAAPDVFNAYWLQDGNWVVLPPLGLPSTNGARVPSTSSLVALTAAGSRVIAIWVDALEPQTIVVRTLDVGAPSTQSGTAATTAAFGAAGPNNWAWSAPIVSHLTKQSIPAKSRLFALMLDNVPYVLWSAPSGGPLTLHGGPLGPDLLLNESKLLPTMNLGPPSDGAVPETDVAVGAVENSIVSVVLTKDDKLSTSTFSERGALLAGPAAVEPRAAHKDLQVGQNIALLMLVLVSLLSLWQWRQKPIALALPTDMVAAPLTLRAAAFAIDAAIPLLIVLAAFGELGSAWAVINGWLTKLARPDQLLRSPELLCFLGGYVLHVTIGELFFRRSIGKAVVGLQVLMMDGKPPTVAAILLRNLVRAPELLVGFVIFFVLISEQHQRLGDLLARTLVVAAKPPEIPEDAEGDSSAQ